MNPYTDQILDHYHNPRHRGVLPHSTHESDAHNPSCGDHINVQITVAKDRIRAIAWTGEGCAISQAAASLLTDHVVGHPVATLASMDRDAMLELLAVPISAARIRCALLALETAQKALVTPLKH